MRRKRLNVIDEGIVRCNFEIAANEAGADWRWGARYLGSDGRFSRGVLRGALGFGCCRLGFVAAAIEWEELNKRSINDIAR